MVTLNLNLKELSSDELQGMLYNIEDDIVELECQDRDAYYVSPFFVEVLNDLKDQVTNELSWRNSLEEIS